MAVAHRHPQRPDALDVPRGEQGGAGEVGEPVADRPIVVAGEAIDRAADRAERGGEGFPVVDERRSLLGGGEVEDVAGGDKALGT